MADQVILEHPYQRGTPLRTLWYFFEPERHHLWIVVRSTIYFSSRRKDVSESVETIVDDPGWQPGVGIVRLPAGNRVLKVWHYEFIWTWNEFFLALILLVSSANQTVPIAIATLQGQHNMDVTTSSSSALLGVLPCILFFVLFQRTLTRGITAGSIK